MPVANYGPYMLAVFKHAANKEVEIHLPTAKNAIHLRYRFNNLRSEMRKENHYLRNVAEGVQFSIRYSTDEKGNKTDGPATVIARPADNTFIQAIRDAGITIDEPTFNLEDDEEEATSSVLRDMFPDETSEEEK